MGGSAGDLHLDAPAAPLGQPLCVALRVPSLERVEVVYPTVAALLDCVVFFHVVLS